MARRTYKGNTHSENGWPIVDTQDIQTSFIPGMNNVRIELLKGDVTTVLVAWLTWYHQNVEPIDLFQPRDEWGFSWDNDVDDSNHLSGTAVDINATQYPWGRYVMKQDRIDKINQGIRLFEGNVFWGRNWQRPDEMHFQIGHDDVGRLAAFAQKLKDGYLSIYKPADPNAFPLPDNRYYYGPLEGDQFSVSGLWHGDLPAYKEGLKRWQREAGIGESGVWDAATASAARSIQKQNRWPISGFVYEGEWNVVVKDGQNPELELPTFPLPDPNVEQTGVYWADVSQYQPLIDNTYPHRVVSFRSNSGDKEDTKFRENYMRALDMVSLGQLDAIIVYYFFRPGQANCDLWNQMVRIDNKIPDCVVCMVDVEGAPDKNGKRTITGNNSFEINDEIVRLRKWLGDDRRVIGYHNPNPDPDLWTQKPPGGINLIVPKYNNDVSKTPAYPNDGGRVFGHQYSDKIPCSPFGPCDANFSNLKLSQFLDRLGIRKIQNEEVEIPSPPITPPAEASVTIRVKELTGPNTSAAAFGIGGTDLGIVRRLPNGRDGYFYGDTFDQFTVGGPGWRSPVLLYSDDISLPQLNGGVDFHGAANRPAAHPDPNYATQLWDYPHNNPEFSTVLPTDALVIGSRTYLFVAVCRSLADVAWTEIAYSDDSGATWNNGGPDARREGNYMNSMMQSLTWEYDETTGYVYIYANKFLAGSNAHLWRCLPQHVLMRSHWEGWGWNGANWGWSRNPSDTFPAGTKIREMCLRKVQNNWVLVYTDVGASVGIKCKVLPAANGNLHTAPTTTVVKNVPWGQEAADPGNRLSQPYGGYIIPGSTLNELHVVCSQWDTVGGDNWPYRSLQFKHSVKPVIPVA